MIRSSVITLKFANTGKRDSLSVFIDEYTKVVRYFVDTLWDLPEIPRLLPKELTQIKTWLTARAVQCAAKQASGIVRGTQQKNKRRAFKVEELNSKGYFKQARKLQKIIDKNPVGKPILKKVNPELDPRFVKISLNNANSFDGWITLTSLGNKLKLTLPFRRTKHLNKLLNLGTLKSSVRISKDSITLIVEIPDAPGKAEGRTVGVDIGASSVLSCSDGIQITDDKDGWTLTKILQKLSRKKRGSKSFKRTIRHRTNFINWSVNQLNFQNIKTLKIENIKNLRYKKNTSRLLNHFVYTDIFDKLENKSEELGVQVVKTKSAYTSQRCSECGWVQKSNRNGKQFKCVKCSFATDSDLNAAVNISLQLSSVKKTCQSHIGFYQYEIGKVPIVPSAQKLE